MSTKQKVFVGLSGGVDSSVAAARLIADGYDVTGVFIKIWQPSFTACTWKEDRLDAMRVAVALHIPLETLDLSDEYEQEVITRMKDEYARGETPNPDILCNRFIKFGAFRAWAHEHGTDLIATGHHAQVAERDGEYQLLRGADPGKDQAYFLSALTQDDLAHTLLPIGHMTKREVRAEAARLSLPSAERPDSQGLCFVGAVDMHDFLRELLKPSSGAVLDAKGDVIGEHDGAALYTLGQRHKFRLRDAAARNNAHTNDAHYVIRIDTKENTITVGPSIDPILSADVSLRDASWTGNGAPASGPYAAEVRYHQKPQHAELIELDADKASARVVFREPQLAVPGQSLVLYDGDRCLGGGIIETLRHS